MGTRYFDYVEQFWRENEIQMFSAKETQLYFFFLAEYKRQRWSNPFGCSTQRISNNLGMSRQTLCRIRKKLQDRGLIICEEGKNSSQMPNYTLLADSRSQPAQQNVTLNGTLHGTANVTVDGTIIKDNIDKSIINKEELYPLEQLRAILYEDHDWQGNVREYADKQGIVLDEAALQELLGEFFLYLQTCGAMSKTVPDTQRHFVNWLVKKRNGKERRNKQFPAKQTGVILKDNSPDKFKNITGW